MADKETMSHRPALHLLRALREVGLAALPGTNPILHLARARDEVARAEAEVEGSIIVAEAEVLTRHPWLCHDDDGGVA